VKRKGPFTITGTIAGHTYTVTWEAGELSGDPEAVSLVRRRALRLEGVAVGSPTGPFTHTQHLDDALSAAILISETFNVVTSTRGRVPTVPSVPPGAVA